MEQGLPKCVGAALRATGVQTDQMTARESDRWEMALWLHVLGTLRTLNELAPEPLAILTV